MGWAKRRNRNALIGREKIRVFEVLLIGGSGFQAHVQNLPEEGARMLAQILLDQAKRIDESLQKSKPLIVLPKGVSV